MCSEWHPRGAGARTTGEDKGFRCAHRGAKKTECTQETVNDSKKSDVFFAHQEIQEDKKSSVAKRDLTF